MGGCSNSISLIAGAVVHSSDVGGESVCEVRGARDSDVNIPVEFSRCPSSLSRWGRIDGLMQCEVWGMGKEPTLPRSTIPHAGERLQHLGFFPRAKRFALSFPEVPDKGRANGMSAAYVASAPTSPSPTMRMSTPGKI